MCFYSVDFLLSQRYSPIFLLVKATFMTPCRTEKVDFSKKIK